VQKLLEKLQNSSNGEVLARGAIGTFIVKITGTGILFGLHILLARLLDVTQYGIYVYVLSWVNILVIISMLGLNTSLVRFVAAYNAQEKWGLLRGILRRSTEAVIASSLLLSAIIGIVVWFLRNYISQSLVTTFYVALILLPILTLTRLWGAGLRALKRVVLSSLSENIIRPLLIAAILTGSYFYFQDPPQAMQVMVINLIVSVITFVAVTRWLIKTVPEPVQQARAVYANQEWLKVSLPLLLLAGASLVLNRTDIVMLGAILGPSEAGIYAAASRIPSLVAFGLVSTNAIIAPIISELYYTGKNDELQRIVTLAARGIFAFTVTISVVLAVSGRYLLHMFGEEFVAAYIPLLILLCSQLINALAGSVGFLMIMTGHQNQAGLIVTVSAIANIVLNALLIPRLGLLGAALSTAFTMALWNVAMLFFVQRKLGINSTVITKGFLL
jgi:O-antigen/teichoic acid export membrane protein